MTTIAIIGAGQIGTRHLQSCTKLHKPVRIEVVDPSDYSLRLAKYRYEEMNRYPPLHNVKYYKSIQNLSDNIDIAIIATTADIREQTIVELLRKSQVKYFILEKVVFQKEKSFRIINSVLLDHKSKAWVNCPLRTVPFFTKLASILHRRTIHYYYSGYNISIGSNAIHHLDLFSYLTGEVDITLLSLLKPGFVASKRKGFVDFTGTLLGRTTNESTINLTSWSNGHAPLMLQINSEDMRCIFRMNEKKAWISRADQGWKWSEKDCCIPLQSDLTYRMIEQLLSKGTCNLPAYHESWKIHSPLLQILTEHFQAYTKGETNSCPIS